MQTLEQDIKNLKKEWKACAKISEGFLTLSKLPEYQADFEYMNHMYFKYQSYANEAKEMLSNLYKLKSEKLDLDKE